MVIEMFSSFVFSKLLVCKASVMVHLGTLSLSRACTCGLLASFLSERCIFGSTLSSMAPSTDLSKSTIQRGIMLETPFLYLVALVGHNRSITVAAHLRHRHVPNTCTSTETV